MLELCHGFALQAAIKCLWCTKPPSLALIYVESVSRPHCARGYQMSFVFTAFSRAVSQCMGGAMFCLAWMSSVVLYWVVSRFLARPVKQLKDSLIPLFKGMVCSRSWVRRCVNTNCCPTMLEMCQRPLSASSDHRALVYNLFFLVLSLCWKCGKDLSLQVVTR